MTPRQEAKLNNYTTYIGKFCKNRHGPIRYTSTRQCVECMKLRNGKMVSGLHVETNLRVLPASENVSKRNNFIEELL